MASERKDHNEHGYYNHDNETSVYCFRQPGTAGDLS